MSIFERLRHHVPRIKHSLGKALSLGDREYRLSGYHADRLARDFDDEPHMLPVLRRIFHERDGAFIDVGANCGQTLVKVLATDPDRRYFGFEPQLSCCFYIEQFLRSNEIKTASISPIAMSDTNGMVQLFWDQPNDLTASLHSSHPFNEGETRPHSTWVAARRGDDLIEELGVGNIAAVKIDVEGLELEVLKGLSETLKGQRPVILFEVLTNFFWNKLLEDPKIRAEKQGRADSIFEFLTGLGYSIYRIDGSGEEHPVQRFELDERPQFPFVNDGRDYIAH